MTRTDLINKKVTKLNSIEEGIEMIGILSYDECIAALKECHDLPKMIFDAIVSRAKTLRGATLELIIASMQCVVNQ